MPTWNDRTTRGDRIKSFELADDKGMRYIDGRIEIRGADKCCRRDLKGKVQNEKFARLYFEEGQEDYNSRLNIKGATDANSGDIRVWHYSALGLKCRAIPSVEHLHCCEVSKLERALEQSKKERLLSESDSI